MEFLIPICSAVFSALITLLIVRLSDRKKRLLFDEEQASFLHERESFEQERKLLSDEREKIEYERLELEEQWEKANQSYLQANQLLKKAAQKPKNTAFGKESADNKEFDPGDSNARETPASGGALTLGNSERDFFPGERKEIVLSVLKDELGRLGKDYGRTRRADVLRDMIESNPVDGEVERRIAELKSRLKGYTTMSGSLRSFFESIGFEVSDDSKHYRLTYFGDPRYFEVFSKTASDRREGENIAAQVRREVY